MTKIQLKRTYDAPAPNDGFRVLVDRIWPRGLSKAQMPHDLWAKQLAPSNELRKWFHENQAERWPEFRKKYIAELEANPDLPDLIAAIRKHATVTLLFAAKDVEHNQAPVLRDYLQKRL